MIRASAAFAAPLGIALASSERAQQRHRISRWSLLR